MRERTIRRITLTTQTLIKSLLVVGFYSWYIKGGAEEGKRDFTYKVAKPKMPVKRIICSFDVCSRQRTGMGFIVFVSSVAVTSLHMVGTWGLTHKSQDKEIEDGVD